MPFRTRRAMPAMRRGPKPRYQWVRSSENSLAIVHQPGATLFDLLKTWRVANNITLQLPDLVIWRIHIRVTIRFNLTVAAIQASQGAHIAIYCDDAVLAAQATTYTAFLEPYSRKFLMWDMIETADNEQGGGFTNVTLNTSNNFLLSRPYDIRSHRKLQNQEETLLLSVTEVGQIAIQEIAFTQSTLLRLPR